MSARVEFLFSVTADYDLSMMSQCQCRKLRRGGRSAPSSVRVELVFSHLKVIHVWKNVSKRRERFARSFRVCVWREGGKKKTNHCLIVFDLCLLSILIKFQYNLLRGMCSAACHADIGETRRVENVCVS